MVAIKKRKDIFLSLDNNQGTSGFTLIELIIAMAFLAVIITLAGTIMVFSNKAQAVVSKEFQIQSDMRIATEILNQEIRYSSAVFMMNENQYKNSSDIKSEWNYVVLSDDKKEVKHYLWDASSGTHKITSLVKAQDHLIFGLNFNGVNSDSKLVHFKLDGFSEGSSTAKISVSTTLNAINSAVVDDSGTLLAPSLALAYRSDDIPDPDKVTVAVTMVLDESGSMAYKMGGDGIGKDEIRTEVLKEKAKELIDTFSDMENVSISLIPFSTNANKAYDFLSPSISTNKVILKNRIDSLNKVGGTNAGDGLRRSYYNHIDFSSGQTNKVLNYTILLMDGNPTYWPSKNGSTHFYGTGNLGDGSSNIGGNGSTSIDGSMGYIESFSDMFINKSTPSVYMKTFVIGFTGIEAEVTRAKDIAKYHNHDSDSRIKGVYYSASNSQELKDAFTSIAEFILSETWHIYGPLQ